MIDKDYTDYLQDILDSIIDINNFISGMNYDEFINDKKTINAVIRSLEIIGEAAKKLSIDIKEEYPDIPWRKVSGMRDKLIHDYFGVDLEIVWQAVNTDIPPLKQDIKRIINDQR